MAADIRAIVHQAAARYGVDPVALWRVAQLESGGNPLARNPNSSAGGLFQFINGTAQQYGLADRFDPTQAADAGARFMRDNRTALRNSLGRDPTGPEVYLAHQQGAGGAAQILRNPNAPAAGQAFGLNGGRPGMTQGQFAQQWAARFNAGVDQQPAPATGLPNLPAAPGLDPRAALGAMYAAAEPESTPVFDFSQVRRKRAARAV